MYYFLSSILEKIYQQDRENQVEKKQSLNRSSSTNQEIEKFRYEVEISKREIANMVQEIEVLAL